MITINGEKVHSVENKDARSFKNVKVFAGDNFYTPADASYKNFVWENLQYSGDFKKNNQIGFIESWGPLFRVSFDLKIHSLKNGDPTWGWANVIKFIGDLQGNRKGERVPSIFLHKSKNFGLYFANSVNGNGNYHFTYTKFELNKWHNIVIEQTKSDGKVRRQSSTLLHKILQIIC